MESKNPNSSEDFARRKKYVPLGNKLIAPRDLENNVINIIYPTYKTIANWRKTKVSPLFAAIVQGYVSQQKDNPKPLTQETFRENPSEKNLSEEEKEIMGIFLRKVAVRKGPGMKARRANLTDKRRELKILLGMRAAGNNAPEIVADILKKAKYLKRQSALSKEMLRDIIESLAEGINAAEEMKRPDPVPPPGAH